MVSVDVNLGKAAAAERRLAVLFGCHMLYMLDKVNHGARLAARLAVFLERNTTTHCLTRETPLRTDLS